jgi:hypothetical protein
MEENKKYYFISFIKGQAFENSALDEHPMEWQMHIEAKRPGMYKLVFWSEITKEQFENFTQ